jgi:hypothetical protein
MNRTLASADSAHYYLRPSQLSTLPAARRDPDPNRGLDQMTTIMTGAGS